MDEPDLRPLTDAELEAIPVFPLPRVVFFPGSVLPLHLFEPRYRQMMEHCLSDGPMAMAVTMLAPGWEDDYEGYPPIHAIAGAGRIVEHRRRSDGRFDLLLAGVHRVRLEELEGGDRPFRQARATVLPDRVPEAASALLPQVRATAAAVVALIRETYPDFTLDIEADTPPGIVADRIADRLVSEPDVRQRLLEAEDVKVRLAVAADELLELLGHLRGQGRGGALH